jgi:hypothetical protein
MEQGARLYDTRYPLVSSRLKMVETQRLRGETRLKPVGGANRTGTRQQIRCKDDLEEVGALTFTCKV